MKKGSENTSGMRGLMPFDGNDVETTVLLYYLAHNYDTRINYNILSFLQPILKNFIRFMSVLKIHII